MKKVYWIDLFAGGGGTTSGIHLSGKNNIVIACVNHDKNAIESHRANHPNCKHFTEDIRDFKVVEKLKKLVNELRLKHPNCQINIWASLECTNYSKAKGGLPRDGDSRTLAHHLNMYVEALNPDRLFIENVVEFMAWGELDKNGRPISMKKGIDFIKWKQSIQDLDYNYEHQILNSADFGAYTSRKRYFGIFAKKGIKINFPEPTHYDPRKKKPNGLFDFDRKEWKPVKDLLKLNEQGRSIFERKKSLSPNTWKRIFAGLKKFVNDDTKQFITEYYGNGKPQSINKPLPTITTKDRFALNYIQYDYSKFTATSIDRPAGTITTTPKHNLVSVQWLTDTQYGRIGNNLNKPCPTLIARMDKKPIYIVTATGEVQKDYSKEIETDTGIERLTRWFMRKHGITDIKMRMLFLEELKLIQGFDKDYVLKGTKTDQLKQIGNAVVPVMAKVLANANY